MTNEFVCSRRNCGVPPNSLGKRDYKRLAKLELVAPHEPDEDEKRPLTLDEFSRMKAPDWKPASKVVFGHTRRNLLDCFRSETILSNVTVLDAENFKRHLKAAGLAKTTMAKWCSLARGVFEVARKHRLLESNPFQDAKISVVINANRSRQKFIERSTIESSVLAACPDAEWRSLVGLARYGGLRVPSEALSLRSEHINWERGEMLVPSPKTEHFEGHESRLVPLFSEVRPLLQEAFEQAEPGAVFVISRHRSKVKNGGTNWQAVNLRTRFQKIIRNAGVKPWPRLWVNLRSSRATELADLFPSKVAADWLGHTEAIADKHYRQTTREHFERAIKGEGGALSLALLRGASQSTAEQESPKAKPLNDSENAAFPQKKGCFAAIYETAKMDDTELESVTSTMSTTFAGSKKQRETSVKHEFIAVRERFNTTHLFSVFFIGFRATW